MRFFMVPSLLRNNPGPRGFVTVQHTNHLEETNVLKDADARATIAVKDLERARQFYDRVLSTEC
jgi:hypothetical protein